MLSKNIMLNESRRDVKIYLYKDVFRFRSAKIYQTQRKCKFLLH